MYAEGLGTRLCLDRLVNRLVSSASFVAIPQYSDETTLILFTFLF